MAVTFDNSDARLTSAGSPTVSFSYTTTASANRVLLAASRAGAGGVTVTAATYNGVSLTNIGSTTNLILWRLTAPASGANTLSFSISSYELALVATSTWSGVDQTTPLGTVVTNSGTSATPSTGSITCPASGAIYGAESNNYTSSPAPTINTGTLRGAARGAGSGWSVAGASNSTTSALAWNATGSAVWEAIGVPINAVGGSSKLFRTNPSGNLSGLGSSGPFFQNPLQRVAAGWKRLSGIFVPINSQREALS